MAIANFPFQSRFHVLDGCTCTVGYDAYTPLSYETFESKHSVKFIHNFSSCQDSSVGSAVSFIAMHPGIKSQLKRIFLFLDLFLPM